MVNEEKVILMTKMAAFIDREGKRTTLSTHISKVIMWDLMLLNR